MDRTTRRSRKRDAVLCALRSTTSHPTAGALYQALKPEHPDLSLGTVYRNLALLQDQGLVRGVCVVDGHERYDAVTTPHSHFVCSHCHAVMDLPELVPGTELDRAVGAQYGCVVEHHDLTFHGVCSRCLREQK